MNIAKFINLIINLTPQKLSDEDHFEGDEHNLDYDHDAFLGEEADEFNNLSPEESKERLA